MPVGASVGAAEGGGVGVAAGPPQATRVRVSAASAPPSLRVRDIVLVRPPCWPPRLVASCLVAVAHDLCAGGCGLGREAHHRISRRRSPPDTFGWGFPPTGAP